MDEAQRLAYVADESQIRRVVAERDHLRAQLAEANVEIDRMEKHLAGRDAQLAERDRQRDAVLALHYPWLPGHAVCVCGERIPCETRRALGVK